MKLSYCLLFYTVIEMSPCTGGVNTVAQTTEGVEDKLD